MHPLDILAFTPANKPFFSKCDKGPFQWAILSWLSLFTTNLAVISHVLNFYWLSITMDQMLVEYISIDFSAETVLRCSFTGVKRFIG